MYSLKLIYLTLTQNQKRTFFTITFFIIIGAILEMIGLGLIVPAIDIFLKPENNLVVRYLEENNLNNLIPIFTTNYLFIFLFFIYFLKNVYLALLTWIQFKWSMKISNFFSKNLFQKYIKKTYLFHKNTNSSEIFKNLEEIDMFGRSLSSAIALITEIIITLTITIFLIFIEPYIALITVLIFMILSIVFYKYFKPKLSKYGKERQSYLKGRYKSIQESFGPGIRDIKINNREQEFVNEYDHYNTRYNKFGLFASMIQETPKYLFEQIAILLIIIIVTVLSILNKSQTEMISLLGLFLLATFKILPSIRKILHSYQYINYGSAAIRLIKNEFYSNDSYDVKYSKTIKSEPLIFNNQILFKDISFGYENKKIFQNLNFKIEKNSSIGLLGESGVGKSTLIDLIAGLLDPSDGKIYVDNKNIQDYKTEWQNKIGYVPQNIYLLDATIKENIIFSKSEVNISDEALEKSIQNSGLEKFINSLEKGVNTQIGELGSKLSGGQIQRIGIARALYKNPEILILDEATNALDEETETQILKSICHIKNQKTLIIISHKKITYIFVIKSI